MIILSLMDQPFVLLAWVIAIVFVLTVHEFSHALAAHLMGDQTAKMQGRLTLNPLSHICCTAFFMLLLVLYQIVLYHTQLRLPLEVLCLLLYHFDEQKYLFHLLQL